MKKYKCPECKKEMEDLENNFGIVGKICANNKCVFWGVKRYIDFTYFE